jgi:hypothetical protein
MKSEKNMSRGSAVLAVLGLCGIFAWTACSTAWIGEAEQIVAALTPGVANLVTLVATLEGEDTSAADVQTAQSAGAQVEGDLQLLQSLITQYQKADVAAQSGLLNQIQAEVSAVEANLGGLMTGLHIKDKATQAKITAVVGVLLAEVQSVAAILPASVTGAPSATMVFAEARLRTKAPLTANAFVGSYNKIMTARTGEARLDRAAASLQIHLHGKFARSASVGLLK